MKERINSSIQKLRRRKYFDLFFVYSISFCVLFFLCWALPYLKAHRSFIWSADGLSHSYASFVYTHNYVRHVIRGIVYDHRLVLPAWDYTLGYGSDIMATMGTSFYDPFGLIFAPLFPVQWLEPVFDLLVVFKSYLVGASFIAFAKHRDNDDLSSVAGALVYTFAFTTSVGLAHIGFFDTFILLPLILIGVDRQWEKKSSRLYVFCLAIAFMGNFYFTYMIGVVVFFYCVHRYVAYGYHGRNTIGFLRIFSKIAINTIAAFMIAIIALMPTIVNLVGTDRLSIERVVPLFYDKGYYTAIMQGYVDMFDSGRDWYLGFPAVALLFVFTLMVWKTKKHLLLKLGIIEMTIGLCIPYFGHVMNGFNYVSNRWIFAYLFCFAYAVTAAFEALYELSDKKKTLVLALLVLFGTAGIVYFKLVNYNFIVSLGGAIVIMIFVQFMAQFKISHKIYERAMLVLVALSVLLSASNTIVSESDYHVQNSIWLGTANGLLRNSNAAMLLQDVDKTVGARYDSLGLSYIRNASWTLGNGLGCMDMYINLYNNDIDLMNKHLAIATEPFNFSYKGVNGRAELAALYGANYFTAPKGRTDLIPVDYTQLINEGTIYDTVCGAYKSVNDISMAYFFDTAIGEDEYLGLSPYERQQALMQSIVLEEGEEVTTGNYFLSDDKVPYRFSENSQSMGTLDSLNVQGDNNRLELELTGTMDQEFGEWYVYLENLQCVGNWPKDYHVNVELFKGDEWKGSYEIWCNTPENHMYGQKHDWLIRLGNFEGDCDRVVLTFKENGIYSLNDIAVYNRPESLIRSSIQGLDTAGDLKLYDNRMEKSVDADKDRWLFISQPYAKGWNAVIDGQSGVTVYKADDAFMAVKVPAGHHEITFKYTNPSTLIGFIISLISLFLYIIGYICLCRKKESFNG